jgi:hypothetical protein
MAIFQVHEVFRLATRQQFVIAGNVVDGAVVSGMNANIVLQDKLTWTIPIVSVEFIDQIASAPKESLVGLVFAEQSSEDAYLCQGLCEAGTLIDVSET